MIIPLCLYATLFVRAVFSTTEGDDPCSVIQTALDPFNGGCRCYTSGLLGKSDVHQDSVWIGCTRKEVLDLHAALTSLPNETAVYKLWIWDSLIPVVPEGMFAKIRPRHLIIEGSAVGKFNRDAFKPISDSLKSLELKNNIVRELEGSYFEHLRHLHRLDLSGNEIQSIRVDSFETLGNLKSLSLYRNHLNKLNSGVFAQLKELRRLNLGGNSLTKITASTFYGLDNLEHLNLENNQISYVHPKAFQHMKGLKTLNLGGNLLYSLELNNFSKMEKLQLHNNSFFSIADLRLKELPQLEILGLDQNHLETIQAGDFSMVSNLRGLSLASNQLRTLPRGSFQHLRSLTTLSLQNNHLARLADGLFFPLAQLRHLFLSQNQIAELPDRAFYGLKRLKVLSLSKNRILKINRRSFSSLQSLERLFVAHNDLRTLQEGSLDYFQKTLYAIDLSENPWNCQCDLRWLSKWAKLHRDHLINLYKTKCDGPDGVSLADAALSDECGSDETESDETDHRETNHSVWITVIGLLLAVVTVLILIAVALLCLQNGYARLTEAPPVTMVTGGPKTTAYAGPARKNYFSNGAKSYDLRRVPSDMVTLIPRAETVTEKRVRFDDTPS